MITRAEARELGVSKHLLASLVRSGGWRRLLRSVYVAPDCPLDEHALRRRAALRQAGTDAVLTSMSALAEYRIDVAISANVHLGVATGRASTIGIAMHRRRPGQAHRIVNGVHVAPLTEAIVTAWPELDDGDRKEALCVAVRDRGITVAELRAAAVRAGAFPGRSSFLTLLELVTSGCQSPIEIDYVLLVERPYGLPVAQRQVRFRVADGWRYGDVFYEAARVLVELDGRADHSSDARRRADLQRDAELARQGILTLRFTGHDVRTRPGWVASVVRETLAGRSTAGASG